MTVKHTVSKRVRQISKKYSGPGSPSLSLPDVRKVSWSYPSFPNIHLPSSPRRNMSDSSPDKKTASTTTVGTDAGSKEDDYVPQNILLTGGAGFIASHVAILLCKKYPQYRIICYDKLDYCSCRANISELEETHPNFKFVKGDIASPDLVSFVLQEEQIDTIMHFAAQTHVDNSFGNSFNFTHTNIYGTHVLLESAKTCSTLRRFIHVSTDEVYGEGEDFDAIPMCEEHVLEPTNPYAATKAGAEFIVKSYHRSFQLPAIITRGNNVYGPHQYPEKLIPKFVNQLLRGLPVTLHGDGSNTRNFLFVEDVARAFDAILHKGVVGHIYNIGGDNELSNLQVAKDIIEIMHRSHQEDELVSFVSDRKFNDLRYTINSTKLHKLGWKEEMPWKEGLRATIKWYEEYTYRYGNIDQALVPHPRIGSTPKDSVVQFPTGKK